MSTEMNFDANSVKPAPPDGPPLVPIGWHMMAIVASEMKTTNDGKGKYLKLEHQVIEGEYKGRKVWVQLNLVNPNETTVKIAQEQLSAICHATGVLKLKNSSQLHNIPMQCRVTIRQSKGYDPQNDIKGWKAPDGGTASVASPAQPTATVAAAAAPASANAPAWAQKKSA
jgi:hypothetical protein